MEKYIYDESNCLWYELCGDYYLPCLTVPESKPVGGWGRRYRNHLKEHRAPVYTAMLLAGTLSSKKQQREIGTQIFLALS